MKKLSNIALLASGLLLAASCRLDFIDDDNVLCHDSWQYESVTTCSPDGTVTGFEDKTGSSSYVKFFYTGAWSFESESCTAPEYGLWSTEIVPVKGATFDVILISDNPGSFIQKGHSGEVYKFSLTASGDTLSIIHKHTDADEYRVNRFLRSSFSGFSIANQKDH